MAINMRTAICVTINQIRVFTVISTKTVIVGIVVTIVRNQSGRMFVAESIRRITKVVRDQAGGILPAKSVGRVTKMVMNQAGRIFVAEGIRGVFKNTAD